MLIILEGVDRTGKTTLAEALTEQLDAELRHCEKPERHPLDEYEADLDDYVPGVSRSIVYDRHLWGERVWPKIYDRETLYTDAMHHHAEMFLRSRGAIVVHCTAAEDDIITRLRADDDPYPPPEKVGEALELFRRTRRASILPTLTYDFEFTTLRQMMEDAIAHARFNERWVKDVPTLHWVGDPSPDLLLVGDRPGPKYPEHDAIPFRPLGGTAGDYLMRTIGRAPYTAITNARRAGDYAVPLGAVWEVMGFPHVVALGVRARDALEAAEVPHGVVPHPQWVRRFKHSKMTEYRQLISSAAAGQDLTGVAKTWT